MKSFMLLSRSVLLIALITLIGMPVVSSAATAKETTKKSSDDSLQVAGWIPYWRGEQGVKDARRHLDQIDTLYPFAFTVKSDGMLSDLAGLEKTHWKNLFRAAEKADVEIIPTIMMSDGALARTILSDAKKRKKHVDAIADMVKKGGYDGVDIDYEGKTAETKDVFSLFLTELKKKLGKKMLVCTIEPRTPPDSLYKVIPNPLKYSNDYVVINRECDRINIMTYDQQRADLKLNESKSGQPYMQIADVDWVEKVAKLAAQSFPKDKIFLGIATYGYNYQITVAPNWYRDYIRLGALNVPDIMDLAEEYDVEPARNKAGELAITYFHKSAMPKLPKNLKIPKNTPPGMKAAAQALAYANQTGREVVFRYVSYSDAGAMEQKIDLAKELGLGGVSLFKIDGDEDRDVWKLLK